MEIFLIFLFLFLIVLWSKNTLRRIYKILNFLRLVLWSSIWSDLVIVLHLKRISVLLLYWMEKSTDNNYLKLVNSSIQVFRAWGRVVGKKIVLFRSSVLLLILVSSIYYSERAVEISDCVFVHFSLQFISFSSMSLFFF